MGINDKLRDDDILVLILTGADEGRHVNLKLNLAKVLYHEEHPKPKEVDGKRVEVELHHLIKERYFTDVFKSPQKSFVRAWVGVLETGGVEAIGFSGDYVINRGLERWASRIKESEKISDADYMYLKSLGQKVRDLRD